jgi:hypothetical protein
VRAWCAWCLRHDLPALPAAPTDIAAFLSEQRYPVPPARPLAVNTLRPRTAAIRYLHYLARLTLEQMAAGGASNVDMAKWAKRVIEADKPVLATVRTRKRPTATATP